MPFCVQWWNACTSSRLAHCASLIADHWCKATPSRQRHARATRLPSWVPVLHPSSTPRNFKQSTTEYNALRVPADPNLLGSDGLSRGGRFGKVGVLCGRVNLSHERNLHGASKRVRSGGNVNGSVMLALMCMRDDVACVRASKSSGIDLWYLQAHLGFRPNYYPSTLGVKGADASRAADVCGIAQEVAQCIKVGLQQAPQGVDLVAVVFELSDKSTPLEEARQVGGKEVQ